MSVAAIKVYEDKIVIGADSQITMSDGSHKKNVENAKIFINDKFAVAAAGDIYEFSLFLIFCKEKCPIDNSEKSILEFFIKFAKWKFKNLKQENIFLGCAYLFVYMNKAFLIDEDFYIKEITDYQAIGSGMPYAETALYFNKDIKESLLVACKFSPYCSIPVMAYEIFISGKIKEIK